MDHDLRVPYIMSEECIDLVRKMLDRDVERRVGIQGILGHAWVTAEEEEEEEERGGDGLGEGHGQGTKTEVERGHEAD